MAILDPVAASLVQFYPQPTVMGVTGTTNFVGNSLNSTKDKTNFVRIDHAFSDSDRLNGHIIYYSGNVISAGTSLPTTGGTTNAPVQQNYQLGETHTFSPTLLNELRLGYSRNKTHIDTQDTNVNAQTVLAGVPGVVNASQNPQDAGIPTVSITSYAGLGSATNIPQGRRSNTYEIFDDATKITTWGKATHTIKFGWYGRREETWRYLDGTSRGSVSFTSWANFAGNCATCLGVSQINSSSIHTGDTLGHWYRYPEALYVQDDIKTDAAPDCECGTAIRAAVGSFGKTRQGRQLHSGGGAGAARDKHGARNSESGAGGSGGIHLYAGTGFDFERGRPAGLRGHRAFDRLCLDDARHQKTVIRGGFRIGYDDLFES